MCLINYYTWCALTATKIETQFVFWNSSTSSSEVKIYKAKQRRDHGKINQPKCISVLRVINRQFTKKDLHVILPAILIEPVTSSASGATLNHVHSINCTPKHWFTMIVSASEIFNLRPVENQPPRTIPTYNEASERVHLRAENDLCGYRKSSTSRVPFLTLTTRRFTTFHAREHGGFL